MSDQLCDQATGNILHDLACIWPCVSTCGEHAIIELLFSSEAYARLRSTEPLWLRLGVADVITQRKPLV